MRQIPVETSSSGIVAADEERVPDRPAGEPAHLVERHGQGVLDRGRLVGRGGGAAKELERVGAAPDRVQHAVVLGRDLADLGVRLDANRPGEVAASAVLVHVREEVGDLGAGAVLGDVESGELSLGIDAERKAPVDERQDEEAESERPHEAHADADELDADLLEAARGHREGIDVAEETDGERSPDARAEVDRHGADSVVDLHPLEGARDEPA